jgi:membrane-bound lytic murein transglycosylase MltF
MNEVHFEGRVSLHVHEDGAVELREPIPHNGTLRFTTADDPVLRSSRKRSEGGLSINEVCRRYADRAGVDFEVAAAAVLDALEAPREADDA